MSKTESKPAPKAAPKSSHVLLFAGPEPGEPRFLGEEAGVSSKEVSTRVLKRNLERFLATLPDIVPEASAADGAFGVEGLEVAVAVNGKGEVGFLGMGAEAGGAASLTITLRRREKEPKRPRMSMGD